MAELPSTWIVDRGQGPRYIKYRCIYSGGGDLNHVDWGGLEDLGFAFHWFKFWSRTPPNWDRFHKNLLPLFLFLFFSFSLPASFSLLEILSLVMTLLLFGIILTAFFAYRWVYRVDPTQRKIDFYASGLGSTWFSGRIFMTGSSVPPMFVYAKLILSDAFKMKPILIDAV